MTTSALPEGSSIEAIALGTDYFLVFLEGTIDVLDVSTEVVGGPVCTRRIRMSKKKTTS
jgi:hypothetical protein